MNQAQGNAPTTTGGGELSMYDKKPVGFQATLLYCNTISINIFISDEILPIF
jgi:hypothetical protein